MLYNKNSFTIIKLELEKLAVKVKTIRRKFIKIGQWACLQKKEKKRLDWLFERLIMMIDWREGGPEQYIYRRKGRFTLIVLYKFA